jgi:TDG/mug DNA glycosylase family protein
MTPCARRPGGSEILDGATLPDLLGPGTRLLFVGINPGLTAVEVQAPFPGRGNRFFPALFAAGITDRLVDTSGGFAPGDPEYLIDRGIGISTLVSTATARAADLSPQQLLAGAQRLPATVERIGPVVVAFLGITAYRIAFRAPTAVIGPQPQGLTGARLWVVPNPSGLNRGVSLSALAAAYRHVAVAAGLELVPSYT